MNNSLRNFFTRIRQLINIAIKKDALLSFASSFGAILVGLFVGLIILLISNPAQAFNGFFTIMAGGFTGGMNGIGQVLYLATPIIMTGLSVGFAFKTGLFNIGTPRTIHCRCLCSDIYWSQMDFSTFIYCMDRSIVSISFSWSLLGTFAGHIESIKKCK